ncbi:MAG TPA: FAD-binding oxidoreductase [Desulfobacterales bacterium]|nr:FAD-binding oxidoreductase [Desulfobacterales bacterium]
MVSADIIIIGGGLQGLSTALHLARKGKSVTLLEKDTAGRHASGVNAGGVRRLNRSFPEIPLSLASQELWHRIESLVDQDCGFRPEGQIRIAENDLDMEKLEERNRVMTSLGYTHEELVDKKTLRHLVPAASSHCLGALHCRGDGFAEPYLTTLAFKGKAESLGVHIYENSPVTAIERIQGFWRVRTGLRSFKAPVLVNCAGAWGGRIASWIGDCAPLTPTPLTMMVTAPVQSCLKPVVGLASRKLSFKQMPNGTFVIGGGHISKLNMESEKTVIDFTQLKISAQAVRDVFPLLKNVPIVRAWAGIEGFLPDQIPVIGPSRNAPQAFHAFGFCGHGFQLSPIIGQILSELIIHGRSSLPIEAFRIERFANHK